MRPALHPLYGLSGALAALFVLAVWSTVLLQVGLNLIDALARWITGHPVGLVVPSYAEFAGFFLAAATFLALASTWRAGAHIRVTLVLRLVPAGAVRWVELWCVLAAAAIAGYFAYHTAHLCWQSFVYGDVSPGLVPIPLWLPQAAMALGLGILVVALVDAAVALLSNDNAQSTVEAEASAACEPEASGA